MPGQRAAPSKGALGADHPDTLTSRSNLAVAYQAVGDLGRPGVFVHGS